MSFTNEKVVEIKTCEQTGKQFEITDKDLEFYDKISPIFNGKKYSIPTPRLCPEARQQRRLSFRNERKLYKRKCDATGKDIISIYSPDKPYTVYNQDFWWSDNWDPMDYGIDFDFEKGFFEQFDKLMKSVPKSNLHNIGCENSDYVNLLGYSNNCYYSISGDHNSDCYYCSFLDNCKGCLDCNFLVNCSNCYFSINIDNCNNCYYSSQLQDCSNCYFSKKCIGCSNCYGCIGLNNKQYYIYNKSVTKDEFLQFTNKHNYEKNNLNIILKSNSNINSIDCFGDNLIDCLICNNCFDLKQSQNCKNCNRGYEGRDSYDINGIFDGSKMYESNSVGVKSSGVYFSNTCWNDLINIFYCFDCCDNINDCFGCIGLRNKQYCIFNKQYTKEEYNILIPKIIKHMQKTGEWGEFFPSSIFPFGYNETVAQEYFPLEQQEAEKNNFKWSSYEAPLPKVDKIIPANKLPENIGDIPDDILNWAIECEVTKKPFRIIPQELEFYRKHKLPIPKRHPDQRHMDRMKLRNPRKLFTRNCDKCGVEMQTTYSPDRPETVYCEECYNKEFY